MTGDISIVIPTRNNQHNIVTLLNSIARQTEGPLETLVVDGQSSDRTAQIGRDFGVRVISYPCDSDMRGYARNLGAHAARGKFLLFLDSDMELTTGVIEELNSLAAGGVEAAVIPETTEGVGFLGRIRRWERSAIQSALYLVFARFLSRGVFDQSGGFDETILGFEDLDLQATILESAVTIARSKEPIIHHEEDQSLAAYIKKRRYYQATSAGYKSKHPAISGIAFSPIARMKLLANGVEHPADAILLTASLALKGIEQL